MKSLELPEILRAEVRSFYNKTEESRNASVDFTNFNDDISDTKERLVTETLF